MIARGHPRKASWYIVLMMCLLTAMSYLDRYIIALLAEPITKDLGIDDTRLGLIIGLGFGLLYALSGIPIAYFLDRGRRVRIVGVGVMAWSLSTIASGFAPTFGLLLISRAGVAIGEAVLIPGVISLIADLFPRERRTLPTALFMGTAALMGSGAFLLGGLAYNLAGLLSPQTGISAWRLTLVIVGLPGLLLATVWLLTVREPDREKTDPALEQTDTIPAALAYLRRHGAYYCLLLTGICIGSFGTHSFIAWTPTMLIRSYGLSVAEAGYYFGTVGLVGSIAAAVIWPALSGYFVRRGKPVMTLVLLACGFAINSGAMASFIAWATPAGVSIAIALCNFGLAVGGSIAVLTIQSAAPPRMRAKLISLYVLMSNLIGLTISPALSAAIAQHVFAGPDAMRMSLSAMGAVIAPVSALLVLLAVPGYRRAYAEQAR